MLQAVNKNNIEFLLICFPIAFLVYFYSFTCVLNVSISLFLLFMELCKFGNCATFNRPWHTLVYRDHGNNNMAAERNAFVL